MRGAIGFYYMLPDCGMQSVLKALFLTISVALRARGDTPTIHSSTPLFKKCLPSTFSLASTVVGSLVIMINESDTIPALMTSREESIKQTSSYTTI